MENKAHAFLAGLFTIGLVIFIGLAVMWFNRDQTVRVPYDVVTRSTVNGLNPQASVKYRGLDVGKVDSIRLTTRCRGRSSCACWSTRMRPSPPRHMAAWRTKA